MVRSRSDGSVLVAMTAGTVQPKPMSIGTNRLTGKTDAPQQLVHDKRHTRHIARVFQDRQEEKQRHNHGQETQNASHALENAVNGQALHHGV